MHECKQEATLKELIEHKGAVKTSVENIEKSIADIQNNHLAHIYKDIKCILQKLTSRRPSWSVLWIINTLTALLVACITFIFTKLVG